MLLEWKVLYCYTIENKTNSLTIAEAELIFTKSAKIKDSEESEIVQKMSSSGRTKLNFKRFLNAVKIISMKVYKDKSPLKAFILFTKHVFS